MIHISKYSVTRQAGSIALPSMARPTVHMWYIYLDWPTRTHSPTNHRRPWGLQRYAARPEMEFKKVHFLPNDDPVDIRPSPSDTQVQHKFACKILLLYIVPFWRRSQTQLSIIVDSRSSRYGLGCQGCHGCLHAVLASDCVSKQMMMTVRTVNISHNTNHNHSSSLCQVSF